MSRNKGTFNFSSNFEVLAKSPLDAKQLVGLYSDLTGSTTWQDGSGNIWLYDGAIVAVGSDPVVSNNGVYRLKSSTGYTSYSNWVKLMDSTNPSFSGILSGDGSGLYNIPITGVTNLQPYLHTQNTDTQLKSPDGTKVIVQTDDNNNLVVNGNIIQSGSTWETHANHIYTTGNTITLRDGAISTLSNGEYVGFIAKKYDGINDGVLVYDNNGVARVGDMDTVLWTGTTQPLATREELPIDGGLAIWNQTNNRIETITKESLPISTLTQNALDSKSDTGHTHNYLPLSGGVLTGSLSGTTFYGNGAGLTNIPASGVTGLDRIISGSNSAIISSSGLTINTGLTVNCEQRVVSTTYNKIFSNINNEINDINSLNIFGPYVSGYSNGNIVITIDAIYETYFTISVNHSLFGYVQFDVYDSNPINLLDWLGADFMSISFPQFLSNIHVGNKWLFTPDISVYSEMFTSNGGDEFNLIFSGQYNGLNNDGNYVVEVVDTDNSSYTQISVYNNINGIGIFNFYDSTPQEIFDGLIITLPNISGNMTIGDSWSVNVNTPFIKTFEYGSPNTAVFSGIFNGEFPTTQYTVSITNVDVINQEIYTHVVDTINGVNADGPIIFDSGTYQLFEGVSIRFPSFLYGIYSGDTWILSPVSNYDQNKVIVDNGSILSTGNISGNTFYGSGSGLTNIPSNSHTHNQYLPYTGATSDVLLGEHSLKIGNPSTYGASKLNLGRTILPFGIGDVSGAGKMTIADNSTKGYGLYIWKDTTEISPTIGNIPTQQYGGFRVDYNVRGNTSTNHASASGLAIYNYNALIGGGVLQNMRVLDLGIASDPNTITDNFVGLNVKVIDSLGAINNVYGVKIESLPTATNKWGIYDNTNSNWYSSGRIGIGTTSPSEKLHVVGNIKFNNLLLSNITVTGITSGTTIVATLDSTLYDAGIFEYVIKNGINLRAGTITIVHNGTATEMTEYATNDLGNTTDVDFTSDVSGGLIRLKMVTTTGTWTFKSFNKGL